MALLKELHVCYGMEAINVARLRVRNPGKLSLIKRWLTNIDHECEIVFRSLTDVFMQQLELISLLAELDSQ